MSWVRCPSCYRAHPANAPDDPRWHSRRAACWEALADDEYKARIRKAERLSRHLEKAEAGTVSVNEALSEHEYELWLGANPNSGFRGLDVTKTPKIRSRPSVTETDRKGEASPGRSRNGRFVTSGPANPGRPKGRRQYPDTPEGRAAKQAAYRVRKKQEAEAVKSKPGRPRQYDGTTPEERNAARQRAYRLRKAAERREQERGEQ